MPVNADGSYVVANDDAPTNIVSGQGDDITYGDIDTGGGGGEVLGDPSAVYSPIVPDIRAWRRTGDAGRRRRYDRRHAHLTTAPAAPDATTQTTTTSGHARKAPPPRTFRSRPLRRRPKPLRRPPDTSDGRPGSARSTRPGTTLRSPTRTSARPRRTRRWCRKSTPTTMGSPARSRWPNAGWRPSAPAPLPAVERGFRPVDRCRRRSVLRCRSRDPVRGP